MVYGLWSGSGLMVYGLWCRLGLLVYGLYGTVWFRADGVWFMVLYGLGLKVYGYLNEAGASRHRLYPPLVLQQVGNPHQCAPASGRER